MTVDYLDKFNGSMIGVGIGDTLGQPFEGQLRGSIRGSFENFEDFMQNNKRLFKTYTDDTQLTLHVAEALINGNGFVLNTFIEEYIKWLDDPPIGPGYGCISSIKKLKYGISWKEAASNSGGNGTVMRIAPIGLFFCKSLKELKNAAIKSSIITHSHSAASAGAIVVARAIAYLIDKNPETGFSINEFFNIVISSISDSQDDIWEEFIDILNKLKSSLDLSLEAGLIKFSQIGVKAPFFIEEYLGRAFVHPYAISTVVCSIFIFLKNLDSFKNAIYELATAGGDSDTVGAIGGSLAGAYFGLKNIPEDLIKVVRKSKKILKLSETLYNKFKERF
ncbi:MAG: ADP-ribosylglycohydrolase family protein [Promethearchaeota archaeon]